MENKMCKVYDLLLKIKTSNEKNLNKMYKITENFDTYTAENLFAEMENQILFFYDKYDYILKNKKMLIGIPVDYINDIKMRSDYIQIILNNNDKINIEL